MLLSECKVEEKVETEKVETKTIDLPIREGCSLEVTDDDEKDVGKHFAKFMKKKKAEEKTEK